MTEKITLTPTSYSVYNNFDKIGLLLGCSRLKEEKNVEYKQRLFDVFVNRADSSYRGLINGITRELGLKIVDCLKVVSLTDGNDVPLLSMPVIKFKDTKCYLYSDYEKKEILEIFDRWEKNSNAWYISELVDKINSTGYFVATSLFNETKRSMSIFNQSSAQLIAEEDISGKSNYICLDNRNLIPNSVSIISENLTRKVTNLKHTTDYVVNSTEGIIKTLAPAAPGSIVTYYYMDFNFIAQSSPVILCNLQSEDFKTKMFEQILKDNGEYTNGQPTIFGADVFNELLSVFPSAYGK